MAENQQPRLEYLRRAMALAFELGPRVVVAPLPKLPGETEPERARLLREALLDLGRHGDRVGTVLALEVGMDAPEAVATYLDTFDVGSLKVNYDPANLLVNGFDPDPGGHPACTGGSPTPTPATPGGRRSAAEPGGRPRGRGHRLAQLHRVAGGGRVPWLADGRAGNGRGSAGDVERGVGFLKRMLVPA